MPDDRLIHLTLGHSQKINALTDFERGVWLIYKLTSDDFGVMRFSAVTLQEAAGWLERKPAKTVLRGLEVVRDSGLVQTFTHQDRTYCFQPDWQTWQKITHPRQTKQPAPPLDRCDANTRWLLAHHPKGGRLKSWQAPGEKPEETGRTPEVKPEETGPMGNGLWVVGSDRGEKERARESEPFDSFDCEPPERANSPGVRANNFIERYKALHVKLRKGAQYVGRVSAGALKENADFQEALHLVGIYDDARLDKLAYVWLNTDHDFAQNGTRTLAKFRSMASWCEEQLIEWEAKHGKELDVAS